MSLGREEIWRRIAAQKIDGALALGILEHVAEHGSGEQKAAPPTLPLQRLFAYAVLDIGRVGDVRERLALGALVDGDRADAHQRYESLIAGSAGNEVALLRRKGALFLPMDGGAARDAFERAVALAPQDGDAWLGLCLARERTGDRKGGKEAFAKASAHGANLGILDPTKPAHPRKEPAPSEQTLQAIRPIRAGALDAAAELFPKMRDRFRRLASYFPPDETQKWDLVASIGVAWFALDPIYRAEGAKYAELARHLFAPATRRKTFSPLSPSRQNDFDTQWERIGYKLLLSCNDFVVSVTNPLWEATLEDGLSEREVRGRRTRAEEADRLKTGEWVLGRMYNTNDVNEPEHRYHGAGTVDERSRHANWWMRAGLVVPHRQPLSFPLVLGRR